MGVVEPLDGGFQEGSFFGLSFRRERLPLSDGYGPWEHDFPGDDEPVLVYAERDQSWILIQNRRRDSGSQLHPKVGVFRSSENERTFLAWLSMKNGRAL